MNLFPLHQRNENFNLFGLLPSRFLYNKGLHKQPHSSVSRKERTKDEAIEREMRELKTRIADYNANYGDHLSGEQQDIYYESLKYDPENLGETLKQIQDIIRELKLKHAPDWVAALENDQQFLQLHELQTTIEKIQLLPEKGEEYVRQARRTRLHARHEKMYKATERKELWAKQDTYKEVNTVFQSMSGNKEFAALFQSPDGLVSQNQREAREIFLAIMSEKTKNFQMNLALGDEFGNNPEENIENFPFLYSEFLKHEGDIITGEAVSLEDIKSAEIVVAEAYANLKGETAQQVVQNIQSGGANPNDLGRMPAIPDDAGWKERIRILKSWHYNFRDRAAKATDMPQKDSYTVAASNIQLHIQHAQASLSLSKLRTGENVVRSKFTRAEFSEATRHRLAIALAMQKFMKAQEIVDHPYGARSDWRYTLHPTVRRMLIVSTYNDGVATFEEKDGGREYTDKPRGKHHWMLATLVQTDYFNFKEVGDEMDESHTALLKAAFIGGHVAELLEHSEEVEKLLVEWGEVLARQGGTTTPGARKQLFREKMGKYPPKFVAQYSEYSDEMGKDSFVLIYILYQKMA